MRQPRKPALSYSRSTWQNVTHAVIKRFLPLFPSAASAPGFFLLDGVTCVPRLAVAGGIMSKLTHLDSQGRAKMVDVGSKQSTHRKAVATGSIAMNAATLEAVRAGNAPKGDVLSAARFAGIMAAKKTGNLIPLCHPLSLSSVELEFTFEDGTITVTATASLTGKTGVEMEALTAVTVALLTIYDMAKALDKAMVISGVRLLSKSGGQSGDWKAPVLPCD